MSTIQYFGTVSKTGILNIPNRKRLQADLLRFADCSVELTVKKKNRRSTQANRYYWGVVVKEVELRLRELGNDVDSDITHEFLKDRFLSTPLIGDGGEKIGELPGSTADLNTDEFTAYIEKIAQWAAESLGLYIPTANEDLKLQF